MGGKAEALDGRDADRLHLPISYVHRATVTDQMQYMFNIYGINQTYLEHQQDFFSHVGRLFLPVTRNRHTKTWQISDIFGSAVCNTARRSRTRKKA